MWAFDPIWSDPARMGRATLSDSMQMKRSCALTILLLLGLPLALFVCALWTRSPPKEDTFLRNFQANRRAFERLRDLLRADAHVSTITARGVMTHDAHDYQLPPQGNFPAERFQEYMALLKQIGGTGATRDRGEAGSLRIVLWSWPFGFAGETRHAGVCWLDHEPPNKSLSLDNSREKRTQQTTGYRWIEKRWYLWASL